MDAATAEDQAKIQQEQESKALSTLAKLLGLGSSAGLSVVLGSALPECHAQTTRQSSKVTDHPRLRVARAVYAVAEADLQTEVSRQIPWAKWVQVGWGYAPKTDKGNTTYRNQLRLGISLDLPILDWNLGGIAAGKARRQREAELFKEALTEVVGGSNEAAQRWATALERVRHLRTVVVPLADRSVAATSEAVDSGRLTEIELLKARLEALKIRQALLEATQACREAAIDAEAASGQPSPELMPTATVP
jgi:outer membrane protein TolC